MPRAVYDLICPFCKWEGTRPTMDPHGHPFCPACGKPVQFKEIWERRQRA